MKVLVAMLLSLGFGLGAAAAVAGERVYEAEFLYRVDDRGGRLLGTPDGRILYRTEAHDDYLELSVGNTFYVLHPSGAGRACYWNDTVEYGACFNDSLWMVHSASLAGEGDYGVRVLEFHTEAVVLIQLPGRAERAYRLPRVK